MKIAYVCYRREEKFSLMEEENARLLKFLQSKGLEVSEEIWDDASVDWAGFDLVLLKAPWDYFDKYEKFLAWLDLLDQLKVRLLNPSRLVRWNSDKHYLKEIEASGLAVIPFELLEKGEEPLLEPWFDYFSADKLIVKPAVSGGAKNTFSFTREEAKGISLKLLPFLKEEAFLVQPFMPQIQEEGEWSFMYFNGRFSHSLLKKAKRGDFRVQNVHGGSIHPQKASAALQEQADAYVSAFAKECLYARVDGLQKDGKFYLMELELIEPFLYLEGAPESFENYYLALQEVTSEKEKLVEKN